MELSTLYAQILGTTMTITALWLALRRPALSDMLADMQRQTFAVVSVAIFTLLLGSAMVFSHSVWDGTWRVLVSIISWMVLIKGALLLLTPDKIVALASVLIAKLNLVYFGAMLHMALGLTLLYYGFIN